MYIHTQINTYVFTCICSYVCIHTYKCIQVYIYIYMYVYICTYIYVYIFVCTYMYVYIYTHRYSYTYICMYIHVRTIRLIYVYIQIHYIFIYFSKSIECGADVSFVSDERPSVDIDVCAHLRVCVLNPGNYTLKKLVVTGEAELIGTHCNTLQHSAKHCNSLQFTATHCNSLQLTATHRADSRQPVRTSEVGSHRGP